MTKPSAYPPRFRSTSRGLPRRPDVGFGAGHRFSGKHLGAGAARGYHLEMHSGTAPSTALPESLRPLFWDCDFTMLDAAVQRDFIFGRVLASGPLDALRWLRRTYGDDMIRDWIIRHRGRQLSSHQLRFWETIIGLPAVDVRDWIAEPERRVWEGTLGR